MEKILNKINNFDKNKIEHPIYHPERTLGRHIALVMFKARCLDNKTLCAAALLHDICKQDSGGLKQIENNLFYWSNKYHAKEAFDFIHDNDDVKYWLKSIEVDYKVVSDIVKHHMICKDKVAKKAAKTPYMDLFVNCDDMIGRKDLNANGFKSIQYVKEVNNIRIENSDGSTVLIEWKDLPLFFGGSKWNCFLPFIKKLIQK